VPAEVTRDCSPVEIYRRLPPGGEAELIHRALSPGASTLELGCGAGRITHGLVRLGHFVTAVDESAEMLAEPDLEAALREAGLELVRCLDEPRSWSEARSCENRAP